MEYKGREKVLIGGRIFQLHRFTETFSGIRINSWLDDEGRVVKEESPAGFIFIREPKFKAMDIDGATSEMLAAVAAPLIGNMPEDILKRQQVIYRLHLAEPESFDLNSGRQHLDGTLLTLRKEALPAGTAKPCSAYPEALAATAYIQANHPLIANMVREITASASQPLAKVNRLAEWVYNVVEKRPVIGIPDAVSTLNSKKGDCNEHAALFAALSRNAGIPTRIAAGVLFHESAFYYHAWNEVCLDNNWLSIDTTRNEIPADLTHIKFANGETDQQIKIGALIGKLQIEVIEENQ